MRPLVREQVRRNAGYRCEYCRLAEAVIGTPFHVDHIRPRQHGGGDDPHNLALACDRCNLRKGTNLTAIDPQTDAAVPLFNPRQATWQAHFREEAGQIVGLTPTGRATAALLGFNEPRRVDLRRALPPEPRG